MQASCAGMDVDNGDGTTLKDLPCVLRWKLKYFTQTKNILPQIEPAVLHGDGVGLPHLGHQHLHWRQQGAAQEDVWRGAAGAARAGGHARRHGKNIFMFPH